MDSNTVINPWPVFEPTTSHCKASSFAVYRAEAVTDPESTLARLTHFILSNNKRPRGFYPCHCLVANIVESRLHRQFARFELESDSQIWKNFGPWSDSKVLERERSRKSGHLWQRRRRIPTKVDDANFGASEKGNSLERTPPRTTNALFRRIPQS